MKLLHYYNKKTELAAQPLRCYLVGFYLGGGWGRLHEIEFFLVICKERIYVLSRLKIFYCFLKQINSTKIKYWKKI